jgi:uncharacterized protein (TIGR02117 family)
MAASLHFRQDGDASRDDRCELRPQNASILGTLQSGAAIWLLACALLSACSGERSASVTERTQVVYVVQRGWHTGIAVNPADWPQRDWPLLSSFADASYLELGWGDAAYYQADEPTSGTAVASLWPSATVMEVVPLQEIPTYSNYDYYAVALHVSHSELEALADSVDKSFVQPLRPTGKSYRVAAGEARFYEAKGKFHAFRTCNRWTSQLLRLAGCAVTPGLMMTAGQVMSAAKRCDAESAVHDSDT